MAYSSYIHCQVLFHHLPWGPAGTKHSRASHVWKETDPLHLSLTHWRVIKLKKIFTEDDMAINFNDSTRNYNECVPCNSAPFIRNLKSPSPCYLLKQASTASSLPLQLMTPSTIQSVAVPSINNSHAGQYQSAGWCWTIFFGSAMSVSLLLGHRNRSPANKKST